MFILRLFFKNYVDYNLLNYLLILLEILLFLNVN